MVPSGVANQQEAAGDQRALPVPALSADRQQALLRDVIAEPPDVVVEAVDPGDPAVALFARLKMIAALYLRTFGAANGRPSPRAHSRNRSMSQV